MKKLLAIAAVAVGLSVASIPANAQSYVVNGHSASKAEVQLLVSHGAQPGKWLVDGYGISAADSRNQLLATAGASAGTSSMSCCASRLRPIAQQSHRYRQRRRIARKAAWVRTGHRPQCGLRRAGGAPPVPFSHARSPSAAAWRPAWRDRARTPPADARRACRPSAPRAGCRATPSSRPGCRTITVHWFSGDKQLR